MSIRLYSVYWTSSYNMTVRGIRVIYFEVFVNVDYVQYPSSVACVYFLSGTQRGLSAAFLLVTRMISILWGFFCHSQELDLIWLAHSDLIPINQYLCAEMYVAISYVLNLRPLLSTVSFWKYFLLHIFFTSTRSFILLHFD